MIYRFVTAGLGGILMDDIGDFEYDVAVFGSCGHVGLPLSITFADAGLKVVGVDINRNAIDKVKKKVMPFIENGAQPLLERVIDNNSLILTDSSDVAKDARFIIIVPGTPVDRDLNTDLSDVISVINDILPKLSRNQTLILRSTLAPKTTDYIKSHIEKNTKFRIGEEIFLVYAPERIMQGKAIEELRSLPQIIGAGDDKSYEEAKWLFSKITKKIIRLSYVEAELAKLFTNNYRYVNFALANEYFIISMHSGANIYKIINAVNDDYPRAKISKVGFAKGPCLGKDSWLLLNSLPNMSTFNGLISSAYRVNEGLPSVVIDKIKGLTNLKDKKIAVLGLTFKRDCDDVRDSLSFKLIHLLKNEFVDVETHDPYVDNKDIKSILKFADIVIIATNHSYYENIKFEGMARKGTMVVDIWNLTKRNEFIYLL